MKSHLQKFICSKLEEKHVKILESEPLPELTTFDLESGRTFDEREALDIHNADRYSFGITFGTATTKEELDQKVESIATEITDILKTIHKLKGIFLLEGLWSPGKYLFSFRIIKEQ